MATKQEEIADIGGYSVGTVIGIGAFGEVRYGHRVGTDSTSPSHVALKILCLSNFKNEKNRIAVKKEIECLEKLNHSNCIRLFEVLKEVPYTGTWCGSCACSELVTKQPGDDYCQSCSHPVFKHSRKEERSVMVMVQELAAGGEVFEILQYCGKFSEDVARFYFRQLIFGLESMHTQGIVHRDLKPENLVIDSNFVLKIVDFGLAALLNRSSSISAPSFDLHDGNAEKTTDEGTRCFSAVGGLPYSAPEVFYQRELFQQKGYKGESADVWSCAVILYVMLSGRPPFMRPLLKSFNSTTMRRCKHFSRLMKGIGFPEISKAAKDLIMSIFVLDPEKRLTIEKIKSHEWFNMAIPSVDKIAEIMEKKAERVWSNQEKEDMLAIMKEMREEEQSGSPSLSEKMAELVTSSSNLEEAKCSAPVTASSSFSSSSSSSLCSSSSLSSSSIPAVIPSIVEDHAPPSSVIHQQSPTHQKSSTHQQSSIHQQSPRHQQSSIHQQSPRHQQSPIHYKSPIPCPVSIRQISGSKESSQNSNYIDPFQNATTDVSLLEDDNPVYRSAPIAESFCYFPSSPQGLSPKSLHLSRVNSEINYEPVRCISGTTPLLSPTCTQRCQSTNLLTRDESELTDDDEENDDDVLVLVRESCFRRPMHSIESPVS